MAISQPNTAGIVYLLKQNGWYMTHKIEGYTVFPDFNMLIEFCAGTSERVTDFLMYKLLQWIRVCNICNIMIQLTSSQGITISCGQLSF